MLGFFASPAPPRVFDDSFSSGGQELRSESGNGGMLMANLGVGAEIRRSVVVKNQTRMRPSAVPAATKVSVTHDETTSTCAD